MLSFSDARNEFLFAGKRSTAALCLVTTTRPWAMSLDSRTISTWCCLVIATVLGWTVLSG
jgi:hypothetical protein